MEDITTKKTYRNFYIFLLGQQFSLLGSSLVFFVISWWLTVETNNPFILSLSAVLYFIPQIIIAPIAGVLSDRLNRKIIIIFIDATQALITLSLLFLFLYDFNDVWIVILVNTIRSILQAFHVPTFNAIVPSMVPKDRLNRVNGLTTLFSSLVFLVGPIIGGLLFELFQGEIVPIFLIDVFTFLIALFPLLFISIPSVKPTRKDKEKSSFFKEFKAGFITIKSVSGLLSLILLATLANFFIRPFAELFPYFIYDIHNGNAIELAYVSAFQPIANIVGGLINALKKSWKRKTLVMMIGTIVIFLGYSFLIIAPYRNFLFMGIGLFIQGLAFNFILVNYMTILQSSVPPDKVGRVASIDHALSYAFMPLGSIVSGALALIIGMTNLYLIFVIAAIVMTILLWIFTDIHKLDHII